MVRAFLVMGFGVTLLIIWCYFIYKLGFHNSYVTVSLC